MVRSTGIVYTESVFQILMRYTQESHVPCVCVVRSVMCVSIAQWVILFLNNAATKFGCLPKNEIGKARFVVEKLVIQHGL